MLMTTTNGFEGYRVDKYLGVISKDIVFRSGLGKSLSAALTNIVASFSLRDIELSGSSELIANAKDYVIQQFEQLAKNKGANAVIGVDIETSFGEALARVAISGTAVVVSPIIPSDDDTTDDDVSSSAVPITKSNSPEGFVPEKLTISNQYGSYETVLTILSDDKATPSDIIADLVFTNIFGDTQFIENVCFLSIHKKVLKYESKPVRIRLPEHIGPCIDTCSIRIRKYRIDNHLIEISNLEMHPIEELREILNKSIVKNNVDEFGWILDETPGFIRCPNCNERVSKDYMKYQRACKNCGFPRSKSEN